MARRASTHFSYEQRINKILNAVSTDPARSFSLEELAGIACLSPFHLHRVFSAMTGETLAACVRRLRLETAANLLRFSSSLNITAVAVACGFSSSQNFARVFREWMGMSPGAFRAACGQGTPPVPPGQKRKTGNARPYDLTYTTDRTGAAARVQLEPNLAVLAKGADMNVDMKQLPEYRVAYVRQIGPYGPALAQAWERIMAWAGKNGLLGPDTAALGVSWDNPSLTPPERCRYDACVVLPQGFAADEQALAQEGICLQSLPAGLYACYRRPIRMDEYTAAWNELIGVWLPRSGYEVTGPGFEYYHPPLVCSEDPDLACDVSICLMVRQQEQK